LIVDTLNPYEYKCHTIKELHAAFKAVEQAEIIATERPKSHPSKMKNTMPK
jgi:hypothetical protein